MASPHKRLSFFWPALPAAAPHRDLRIWAIGLIVLRFAFGCWLAFSQTVTIDEPDFTAGGIAAWREGLFEFETQNPPLGKLVLSLPWVLAGEQLPDRAAYAEAWHTHDHYELGQAILFHQSPERLQLLLGLGRLAVLVVSSLLLWLMFCWLARSVSARAALAAVAAAFIEPNFLGHSTLATLDVLGAVTIFGAVLAFEHALRRGRWGSWALFAILLAVAIGTKFSAVLLGPILAVRFAIHFAGRPSSAARNLLRSIVVVPALAFLCLWAIYGFEVGTFADSWEGGNRNPERTFEQVLQARHVQESTAHLLTERRIPMPSATVGMMRIREVAALGRPTMLFGRIYPEGTRLFFPAILAIKTPLAILLAAIVGKLWLLAAASRFSRRRLEAHIRRLWPFFYAAMFFLFIWTSKSTIAWRYLLPVVPFLLCLAGVGVESILRTRWSRPAMVVLIVLAIFPLANVGRGIGFFNAATLPAEPYNLAVDSNLDWGQSLSVLDYLQGAQGAVFAPDPEYYGIDLKPLGQGDSTVVLSATEYWGLGEAPDELVAPYRDREPDRIVAHMFLIWDSPASQE
ncbi:glycosyltransferase family 39 protein [bacterium]|nr:glycosyltransferase family 39 protein [bacterium]